MLTLLEEQKNVPKLSHKASKSFFPFVGPTNRKLTLKTPAVDLEMNTFTWCLRPLSPLTIKGGMFVTQQMLENHKAGWYVNSKLYYAFPQNHNS